MLLSGPEVSCSLRKKTKAEPLLALTRIVLLCLQDGEKARGGGEVIAGETLDSLQALTYPRRPWWRWDREGPR